MNNEETVVFVLSVFCCYGCWYIAQSKGRTGWWCLAGLFGNVIGLLVVVFLPKLKIEETIETRLDEINVALRTLQGQLFKGFTVSGNADDESICQSCDKMVAELTLCREFNRCVPDPILKCKFFVARKKPDPTTSA
jgi:hypothetical protein